MLKKNLCVLSASVALAAASGTSLATETGGSSYVPGVENYTCCALPPPGLYGMVFGVKYSADAVKDNNGNDIFPSDFSVNVNAVVPRVVWVTEQQVAGASLGFHAIMPLVDLNVDNHPAGSQHNSGLGDMTLGAVLGWHHSPNLHTVLALDIYAPTGQYDKNDIANIGRNHWAIQPVLGVSYIQPEGFNADLKTMWTYNLENDDSAFAGATDKWQDGQELIMDFDLGWGFGNGWTAGIGGYIYQQLTDDKRDGQTFADNKGKAIAFGPSVRYDSGKGWFITAKYQKETSVENRAEGSALMLKAVFPI